LSISLRADALSMIFAVSASFLWMVTVFYSAGYMRGLQEHEQTRFNTCFALALFGAIGCAFSDNLLTLYLFYEIVSVCTYPLVAHHQDKEGYEAGEVPHLPDHHRQGPGPAGHGADLRADRHARFRDNIQHRHPAAGRAPLGGHRALHLLHPRLCQERHHAVAPLAAGAMVAPTPVSALLHAVAVVKVGVFSTVRVMLYVFGVDA
jgi:multicomponent Na+:H+ antiporter subunit D